MDFVKKVEEKAADKLAEDLVKRIKDPNTVDKILNKLDRGSKVIYGAYKDCPIELLGDQAGIVIDKRKPEAVFLTPDTIKSCKYLGEREEIGHALPHTYFYYEIIFKDQKIIFKDNRKSYVKMRQKYKEAMEHSGVHIS